MLDDVDPGGVHGEARAVGPVVTVVAVLHHHRQPRRTVGERVDLDRLVQDDAVRAQPAPAADRAGPARRALPTSLMSGWVFTASGTRFQASIWSRVMSTNVRSAVARSGNGLSPVAGVPLAPEAVHHQVRELDERVGRPAPPRAGSFSSRKARWNSGWS